MQFAHNGYYKGSTPLGLIVIKLTIKENKINLNYIIKKRAFGRVWFMALVLKTSTLQKS